METITNIKYNINNNSNRHYKIIILIIASENEPYSTFVKYWEKYMNLFPEVRCFFLYSNPEIDYDVIVNENSIIHKYKEWYEPGILYKTIAGMFICDQLFNYDYILRTNLSSFIHIPRLLDFVKDKPLTNYAAAKQSIYREGIGFLSGAGFILSNDIIKELLNEVFNKKCTTDPQIHLAPDDVAITMILQRFIKLDELYELYELPRYDCDDLIDPTIIDERYFHIRNKTEWKYHNREYDIENMKRLVEHFYLL
jgi:hypothetical protein